MRSLALSIEQFGNIEVPPGVPSGGLFDTGQNMVQLALNLIFILAIVLAIVFIIFSGIQWILSGGDKQKVQAARNRLIYTIIGFLVIAASFLIVRTIITLLGGNPEFFLSTP